MSNPPLQNSGSSDDSWGKIASDLFGIQFSDNDDFEFPDDDAPKKSQPVASVSSGPVASQPAETSLRPSEPEQSSITDEPIKASDAGNEDHDEFWDILES